MKKDSLLYLVATWNSDPYLIESEDEIEEIWNEISDYGYHIIAEDSEDYEVSCLQLDLDPSQSCLIFQSNNFTCKFGGLKSVLESENFEL